MLDTKTIRIIFSENFLHPVTYPYIFKLSIFAIQKKSLGKGK